MIYSFRVDVKADTLEQAEQVMNERASYDEDYGFEYTLNDPIFLGMGMDQPPQSIITTDSMHYYWTRESPSQIDEMLLHSEPTHLCVYAVRGINYEKILINKSDIKTVKNYS